jgi:hypothetical protein
MKFSRCHPLQRASAKLSIKLIRRSRQAECRFPAQLTALQQQHALDIALGGAVEVREPKWKVCSPSRINKNEFYS